MQTANLSGSQKEAVAKLSRLRVGALYMEAGTGKTRSAIELLRTLPKLDYILWLTPFRTKDNLSKELQKWGGLNADIVGIETVSSSAQEYLRLHRTLTEFGKSSAVIVDESLKIKNFDAIRTKRIIELGKLAEYRLILNGTPLSRNLLDLWAQMEFLSPKILKMDLAEFKNTFCEYIKVTYHSAGFGQSYNKEIIKKYHNVAYLYSLIQPFIFESKLSLSIGHQHINFDYKLTDEEMENHVALKNKYLDNELLMAMNNNIFLEITQKMQHNYTLSPAKFKIVDKLLSKVDKSKVLIYAKYIQSQEELAKHYKGVRIMSIQKHSYGLNLQDYNVIVFWDKTWDYAQREQIERRIYRTGQKSECIYYDLTGNVGLEAMINQNIERKRNLLNVFAGMSVEELKNKL